MAQNTTVLIMTCIIALLIGGAIGFYLMPEKVKTVEKLVEISVPQIEVQTKEVVKLVPMSVEDTYLQPAIKDFLAELNDDDSLTLCDGSEFDEDQVKLKSTPNDYTITIDKDKTEIEFEATLKYLDKDIEEKCYRDFDVRVVYEDGEDTVVDY